jgi:hypothetical protein
VLGSAALDLAPELALDPGGGPPLLEKALLECRKL